MLHLKAVMKQLSSLYVIIHNIQLITLLNAALKSLYSKSMLVANITLKNKAAIMVKPA